MSSTTFLRGENPLRADKLNTAFSERVWRRGDTMQGMLTLWRDPINLFDAATKQYVDTKLGLLPPGSLNGGGTLNGPLYFTTTGGNTMRSAQDRAADVANVLDFGADPTGVMDSSTAINVAASQLSRDGYRYKAVRLPTGQYKLQHQIILSRGQAFYGDSQGSSVLVIDDTFDPAASSVIVCADGITDPGPTIRDLYFWFHQPSTVTSRSTFKTLTTGGTSVEGGTGVQYPWVISTSGNSGRVHVERVCITGAWNGINADACCFWIDGLKISAFNIGIAIGGTIAAPVLDWTFLSNVEFWTFGLNTAGLKNVYMDGATITMRCGPQNGLTAQNIGCFASRLVFTAEAYQGWFSFTNLGMDAWQSTIEVATCAFLQIANLYCTGDTPGLRPIIGVQAGRVMISNWYGTNNSPHPMLVVTGGDVTVTGGYLSPYNGAVDTLTVAQTGTLRISGVKLHTETTGAWARPLINQYDTSVLQVDGIDVIGLATSGTAVQFNSDQRGNYLGRVAVAAGWTVAAGTFGPNGRYGDAPIMSPVFTGTLTSTGPAVLNAGVSFNGNVASGPSDLSKHIELYSGYGFSLTSSRVNYVAPSAAGHYFLVNALDRFSVTGTGMGFNGTAAIAKPTVTGAWAGNTAGKALTTALAAYGLVTDSTSA